MEKLRISEAQVLYEVTKDPTFRIGFQTFVQQQHEDLVMQLLQNLKLKERDTMREAQIAGKIDVYEILLNELEHFATRSLKEAVQ